jgi:hypothetical protein
MLKAIVRLMLALVMLVFVLAAGFFAWDIATYDPGAWRADFMQLKRELALRYANLDWIVQHRRLNLADLEQRTSKEIDDANSRVQATLALRRFVHAFKDPHLKLVWRKDAAPTGAASVRPKNPPPGPTSCSEADYTVGDASTVAPFHLWKAWVQLGTSPFYFGQSGEIGVIRIAAFGEDRYLPVCNAVFQMGQSSRELRLSVRAQLQQELKSAIGVLRMRGVKKLVIDVTGNGGGTEWATEVATLMTDRTLVRQPPRLAAPSCDRSEIWLGKPVCPVLTPIAEPLRLQGSGEWIGPMFVLVDQGTGSAAEDFVAWLKENEIAKVVGVRTAGAGCGYVNGQGRIALSVGWFDVLAPNCARFLKDGTNEIEGIVPDIVFTTDRSDHSRWANELASIVRNH